MPSFLMLDDVKDLIANDVLVEMGIEVPVSEAGPYLDQYYQSTPRWNYGGQTGKFWDKVHEVADILNVSNEWPFEPIEVWQGSLQDGHHRTQAALLVEWDKPIPCSAW